jgi:cyclopropane-fatty-acyl-phospholipid synthase
VALLHTIGRMRPPGTTSPWILKYIFPGGYIPALSEVMLPVERESLWACDIEVWRLHYAKTLRNWQERFEAAVADPEQRARIPVLQDERFVRMWKFYLAASEMSFRHGGHDVFQIQLSRKQDAVPLTRDYLYADARSDRRGARSAEAAE